MYNSGRSPSDNHMLMYITFPNVYRPMTTAEHTNSRKTNGNLTRKCLLGKGNTSDCKPPVFGIRIKHQPKPAVFLEVPAVHFQGYLPRIVGWWSSKDIGLNTFEQLYVGFFGEVGVGRSTGWSVTSKGMKGSSWLTWKKLNISLRIHVWYIYLHLGDVYGKCRLIYHTWILRVLSVSSQTMAPWIN